ncbi:putative multiple sugar transport system substrate-binding protein [Pseudobutyrivibrio sp. OR37]|uniref:substrate-binding domain-containing protein n=1 Tax=Pseudobutyrivibrio sp. OR37 TaxID=1798186 RepID=UPI0008E04C98|nr:sugar-binding protein [Pseudobutyrivibrio sp. OR37]SFH65025.1 putative multiple sugar transport system substrate-binding protein [Pseudobutyrivibrio sp. OR37]
MKKRTLLSMAMVATMMVATFAGCGGSREGATDTAEQPAAETTEAAAEETTTADMPGFDAGATIGVSLPWLGTQNWKEAEDMFTEQLAEAGYNPIVQAADQKVTQQQQQIESMIENGAKVIVVGPVDGSQLGSVLEQAKEAGVYVIGYDRLLENTTGVDGVVQFGSVKTGELQAQALLQGLEEKKGEGPYNIELFGGGPADPNAPNFFTGAMSVLQPKIDDGTVVVVSGQTDFTQCATVDWDNAKAQSRMDSLLSGFYSDKDIHGVLCPNDGIARACITACENAGQEIPVVSGLDAENESVEWVWQGRQYSTVAKPTDDLVKETIEIINSLQAGNGMPSTSVTADNGVIEVPIYELPPVVVTKDNAKEVFANDPSRLDLLK